VGRYTFQSLSSWEGGWTDQRGGLAVLKKTIFSPPEIIPISWSLKPFIISTEIAWLNISDVHY